jgi:hypothetical protein
MRREEKKSCQIASSATPQMLNFSLALMAISLDSIVLGVGHSF